MIMRRLDHKFLLSLTVMMMALALVFVSVQKAGAYFSDYEKLEGQASLKLSHSAKITEEIEDDNKIITISNVGETDILVRVKIFAGEEYVSVEAGEGWLEKDGWYYYDQVLSPEAETRSQIRALVDKEKAPDYDFDIIVILESERAVYEDGKLMAADESWNIDYEGGNGQ